MSHLALTKSFRPSVPDVSLVPRTIGWRRGECAPRVPPAIADGVSDLDPIAEPAVDTHGEKMSMNALNRSQQDTLIISVREAHYGR